MPRQRDSRESTVRFLRLRKMATLAELVLHLECSSRTVHRRLVVCRAIHSYNHNGRYYTLPEIPAFDAHGLWRYRGVFFSRHGNLPATFVQLVHASPGGLTAAEAGELLGLRPSSFLWSMRNHPALKREKQEGLYVYRASDLARRTAQQRHRAQRASSSRPPTDAEAIAILVEKIKQPSLNVEALSARLKQQNLRIEPERIAQFFAHHGLEEKKTPASP